MLHIALVTVVTVGGLWPADNGPTAANLAAFWDGLIDHNGTLDRRTYVRLARDYNVEAIHRELGPDWRAFHGDDDAWDAPEIWQRPTRIRQADAKERAWRGSAEVSYHLGEPHDREGQIFVEGELLTVDRTRGQVDAVFTFEQRYGTQRFGPWQARRDPGLKVWGQAAGQVRAMARANGNGPWNAGSAIIFRSGLLGASGNGTTSESLPSFQFPDHKVPMCVAVTDRNEFVLVGIWDLKQGTGQLAVLAMSSSTPDGKWLDEWDWNEPWPGMHNVGLWDAMKLLGYIDLPIHAPTAISSAADNQPWTFYRGIKSQTHIAGQLPFREQSTRDSFYSGGNSVAVARGGYAVIASKYEKKAVWVDLQPMFEYFRTMYFTTAERLEATRDMGPRVDQWPHCFLYDDARDKRMEQASQSGTEPKVCPRPRIVTSAEFDFAPTAVIASQAWCHDVYNAWGKPSHRGDDYSAIATVDGTLHVFSVGNLLQTTEATQADVTKVNMLTVGRNPCALAHRTSSFNWQIAGDLIVTCRGDREIQWVKVSTTDSGVYRKLRDHRLVDPVYAVQGATGTGVLPHILVCDFQGQQVVGYRTGENWLKNGEQRYIYGCGADGEAEFELGYRIDTTGYPFQLSSSNMP